MKKNKTQKIKTKTRTKIPRPHTQKIRGGVAGTPKQLLYAVKDLVVTHNENYKIKTDGSIMQMSMFKLFSIHPYLCEVRC